MALQDSLGKLGGQNGSEGGLNNINHLFGGNGLKGIVSALNGNGHGQATQSWIGTGANQPISGTDVHQAVDPAALQRISQQTGMAPEEVTNHVAQALPHLVDQATPNGQMPSDDPMKQGGMSMLKHLLHL